MMFYRIWKPNSNETEVKPFLLAQPRINSKSNFLVQKFIVDQMKGKGRKGYVSNVIARVINIKARNYL